MVSKISPRLNIKSSLPKHLDALFSVYVLWVISGRPAELNYGEEFLDGSNTLLKFSDDELVKINSYFECSDIDQDSTQNNPLLKSQIEHLQVGCMNLYKACYFKFQSGSRPDSSERTGGSRFLKKIDFTSVMDLIDGFITGSEVEFKVFSKSFFTNQATDLKKEVVVKLSYLLTFLIEQTKYNDSARVTHDLVVDITTVADLHESGPSRIIKPFIKDGLHQYIKYESGAYQAKNIAEYQNYSIRARALHQVFSPNYLIDEDDAGITYFVNEEKNYDVSNFLKVPDDLPLNLLLKGVPGTGKSRAIDVILEKHFQLDVPLYDKKNKLVVRFKRINLHSASTNSSLMQGISVSASQNNINYDEKTGIILEFILSAIRYPHAPFALILEEIQENNLNGLIGDLIYLIEKSKRLSDYQIDPDADIYDEIYKITSSSNEVNYVTLPNLINGSSAEKRLFLPLNLHVFCTSNYRDDQKIIEDNLLRRFDVVEMYPDVKAINNPSVSVFIEQLNERIIESVNDIHSDRYMIGHANWIDVDDKKSFYKAFLKFVVECKDVRELDFQTVKSILEQIPIPFGLIISDFDNYRDLTIHIQKSCGFDFVGG